MDIDRSSSRSVGESSQPWEVLLELHHSAPVPLRRQLEQRLRALIASSPLTPGARLPSTRALATQLGVSRGVVVDAYDQLAVQGYLRLRPGAAPVVASAPVVAAPTPPPRPEARPRFDLTATVPDLALFPRKLWGRALNHALTAPDAKLGYGEEFGAVELRTALANRLNRARGTLARPDDILVVDGYKQALTLLCELFVANGMRRIGIEDPSLPSQSIIVRHSGLEIVPLPVDADGVRAEDVRDGKLDAVVLTPAHQFPTGSVLSTSRRQEILDWARKSGTFVVEDDYDAEFRYDRQPVGALQGLAPDSVAYVGTTSKILAPALRLGWLLTPPSLATDLATARQRVAGGTRQLDQLALAELISRGDLDRQLARARREYQSRRDTFVRELGRRLPYGVITGAEAGLHFVLNLPAGVDDRAVAETAGREGCLIDCLSTHRLTAEPLTPGLICGYSRVTPAAAPAVAGILARALSAHRPRSVDA